MQKKLHLLFALLIFFVSQAMAQITTSSLSGKITANNEDVIGATIKVTHEPSGTVYGATTNANGETQYVDANGNGLIKGSSSGIYHLPGSKYYDKTTRPVRMFKTISEAEQAGFRAPKR